MTYDSGSPGTRDDFVARLEAADVCVLGASFVAAGTVLVLAAFTVLDWFRDGVGFFAGAGSNSTFGDVGTTLDAVQARFAHEKLSRYVSFGASQPYFSWLGWVLLLVALLAGAAAVSRLGRRWVFRYTGAVVAASGIAITFLALNLVTVEGNAPNNADLPDYGQYLSHAGLGAWAAGLGFLLILVGSLMPHSD